MDRSNLRELRQLADGDAERAKVRLLREFDPASGGEQDLEVPDPYYGAAGGFDEVLDLVRPPAPACSHRSRRPGP